MLRRTFLAQIAYAIRQDRWDQATKLIDSAPDLRSACLAVRQGGAKRSHSRGSKPGVEEVFLLASITKPMTACGVMKLVDAGEVSLADPVKKFLPDFRGGDRDLVTVKHLLTHTSGLPDMLPENNQLRARHAPLADFVAGTCRTPLLFKPGTKCQYQSMGILLAAEIVERITQVPFREFLDRVLFRPLAMNATSLGLGGRRIRDTAQCQVTGNDSWNWNSPYWRNLGAPWGGAHATASDILKLLDYFSNPDNRVLKPETARAMVADQNKGLNDQWGIGWAVKRNRVGKACSDRAFGHSGSTGTMCWGDPASLSSFVLLTTKPAELSRDGLLVPVSDLISEAVD